MFSRPFIVFLIDMKIDGTILMRNQTFLLNVLKSLQLYRVICTFVLLLFDPHHPTF